MMPSCLAGLSTGLGAGMLGSSMIFATIFGLMWFIISLEVMLVLWLLIQKLSKK
jgi:predicted lipid-binding transport protein (Tim44 family)